MASGPGVKRLYLPSERLPFIIVVSLDVDYQEGGMLCVGQAYCHCGYYIAFSPLPAARSHIHCVSVHSIAIGKSIRINIATMEPDQEQKSSMPELKSRQRRRRRRPQKRRQTRTGCVLWIGIALVLLVVGVGWLLHTADRGAPLDLSYEVEGKPTVDAHFIDQVLASYGSPAQGKGQALYDLGVKYGIDPVYALAFFMHESSFGTTGVARVTHSLGNIRVTPGYQDFQGYRRYTSWEEGFEDWYKLIKIQYIEQWSLTTVDQIVPVYAPSADHNDVDAYIHAVEQAVDTWRQGSVQIGFGMPAAPSLALVISASRELYSGEASPAA